MIKYVYTSLDKIKKILWTYNSFVSFNNEKIVVWFLYTLNPEGKIFSF